MSRNTRKIYSLYIQAYTDVSFTESKVINVPWQRKNSNVRNESKFNF